MSLAFQEINFSGNVSNFITGVLSDSGLLTTQRNSSFIVASSSEEFQDSISLSDYEFYRFIKQIYDNPEKYPDALDVINDIVTMLGEDFVAEEIANVEIENDAMVPDRDVPILIHFHDIDSQEGTKIYTAEGDSAVLFIGDQNHNTMIGGDGFNWFMPIFDAHEFSSDTLGMSNKNVVIGGENGYNILDFSMNPVGVDIAISGNDVIDHRISEQASLLGVNEEEYFLTRNNSLEMLRDNIWWYALDSLSLTDFSDERYKNIDFIIGSSHDDIIVGDALGGMTMTGGAGNDVFVVHGGGNRIIFKEDDFSLPEDEAEITYKEIHGFTTTEEAYYFNGHYYLPELTGSRARIDPDILDFSNMDGNLNQEGHQPFSFIGLDEFSGAGAEIRYAFDSSDVPGGISVEDRYGYTRVLLEGDRTGSGEADFHIYYNVYDNPSLGAHDSMGRYWALSESDFFFG